MATPIFDKETWLDISVNIIPMGIITFFVALFAILSPWGVEGIEFGLGFALLVVPAVLLSYLTYVAAERIEATEE